MGNLIRKLRIPLLAVAVCVWLVSGQSAQAQAVYGQILGTVTDASGAIIPNANITVTDVAKGTVVTATSNEAGQFTVAHLIPDTYTVKVTATGFKGFEQTDLKLSADGAVTVSAILGVGSEDQTVTVNADDVPQLKTDRADVSTSFEEQEIRSLPIPDHNFTNLQLLLPGAQQLGWSHAASENPQGSKQIQVDGQAFGGVNYTLDGTDNQDAILGIIVINPNSDSMSEAKIATQNFDAEFGKAVASVVTVQTKSGSNQFHGTAFDNRASSANLARNPFTQPVSVPSALKNQFGGSIGGPVIRNRAFFFADYQGVRQKVGFSALQTVPSAKLVSSCLSGSGCDFSEYVALGSAYQIYQADGTPYPDAIIPNDELPAPALNLFKLLQPYAPNSGGGTFPGLTNNYSGSGSGLFNSNQWDVRGDVTVNDKIHAFARFSRFTDTLTGKTLFGLAGGSGLGLGGFGGSSQGANDSLAAGTDIAVSPKLITDIRLGYFRYNIHTSKYDTTNTNLPIDGENVNVPVNFGAPSFNISDLNVTNPNSGPNNSQAAGSQYGAGLNVDRCNCPTTEREDQFQIVNNWTRTIGNHAVKAGGDIRYARNLRVPSDNDRTGVNQFSTGPTSNGTSGGLGFATFVLGKVTAFNRYASTSINAKEFQKRDFFYIQDTWRPNAKWTVNAGVRYEFYFPERVNGKGNGALLNLDTGYINVAGYGNIPLDMGVKVAKNTWNPRLGVAYQWNPKTVIRAGYGRSFDIGVFGSVFGHVVTQNVPVLANQSINSTGGTTSYAFNLTSPTTTGLIAYQPLTPDSNGHIVNPGSQVNTKARPFTERLPTLDAWNFTIQRSITPTLSVTVAYVGNKGTHTLSDGNGNSTNPNEAAINLPSQFSVTGNALHFDPAGGNCYPAGPNCPADGSTVNGNHIIGSDGAVSNTTFLRRFVGGNLPACGGACGWTQDVTYYGSNQDTHYNALQITAAKTYGRGLSINGNFAYQVAKAAGNGFATWDKQAVIGNDSALRRKAFTGYGLYKLPFGKGQKFMSNVNPIVNYIIGGFEVSPIVIWQSGLPFTLSYSSCGTSIPGSAPCYVNGKASSLHTSIHGVPGGTGENGLKYYDAQTLGGAFTAPGLDTIGNGGRNNAWGPGFFNADISAVKNFTIHEKYVLQFRTDAYNAFNHINFGNPGGNIENKGSITSGPFPDGGVNPRQLQFTARIEF